jgi:hypothetical protein
MPKPDGPPGQQNTKELVNANTGEHKTVTNEEWRTQGKTLRAEGWAPVDETEPPEEVS